MNHLNALAQAFGQALAQTLVPLAQATLNRFTVLIERSSEPVHAASLLIHP